LLAEIWYKLMGYHENEYISILGSLNEIRYSNLETQKENHINKSNNKIDLISSQSYSDKRVKQLKVK